MLRYDFIERESESNLAVVAKNGKWGVVKEEDGKTKTLIPVKYDEKPLIIYDFIFVHEEEYERLFDYNGIQIISNVCDIDQTTPNMIQRISEIFARNPLISSGI